MDLLEEKGVIGAADGSRPRDILSHGGGATRLLQKILRQ